MTTPTDHIIITDRGLRADVSKLLASERGRKALRDAARVLDTHDPEYDAMRDAARAEAIERSEGLDMEVCEIVKAVAKCHEAALRALNDKGEAS